MVPGAGSGTLAGNKIYPDLADDYTAFMTNFYIGAKLNMMQDRSS